MKFRGTLCAAFIMMLAACLDTNLSRQEEATIGYDARLHSHLVSGGRIYYQSESGRQDVTHHLPHAELGGVTGFNSFIHPDGHTVQHMIRAGHIFSRNNSSGWSDWSDQSDDLSQIGSGTITGFNSATRDDGSIIQHLARGGRLWSRSRSQGWSGWSDVTHHVNHVGQGEITGFNSFVHPDGHNVQHLIRGGEVHTRSKRASWSEWSDVTGSLADLPGPITDISSFAFRDDRTEWGAYVDCDRSNTLAGPIHINVLAIEFNPMVAGQSAISYAGYTDPETAIAATRDFFYRTSCGRVTFEIVERILVEEIPRKVDGYQYSPGQWRRVIDEEIPHHQPDTADYPALIAEHEICDRVNTGEIDEVWLFGGPYFGFYETALIGGPNAPAGFNYNGPTYVDTCERLISIGLPGPHTFGHRAEATMTHVYGGWSSDRRSHAWEHFGSNFAQSPTHARVGCGSVHYAPNAQCAPGGRECSGRNDDYDFNLEAHVDSYCDAFLNYPNLGNLQSAARSISCEAWGCSQDGYEQWWWNHLPMYQGSAPNGRLNDWWSYIWDPGLASNTGFE